MKAAQLRGVTDDVESVQALRQTLSHIVAFSTLAAVWAGAERSAVADGLAKVLREALDCDVVYVGLRATGGASAFETKNFRDADDDHQSVVNALHDELTDWLTASGSAQRLPQLAHDVPSRVVAPIGIWAEHGVIIAVSAQPGFPSDTHRLLLNVAANQATLALLTEYAREEQRIADTLQRVGIEIAAEMDPEKLIQAVTDAITALTGADFGAFFYDALGPSGETYTLYTLSGTPRGRFPEFETPQNTATSRPRFDGKAAVRSHDIATDARFADNGLYHRMPAAHTPVRSYLAAPVISRTGKVHGGFVLGHKDVGVFLERQERLAVGVAAWAALAMDNGRLYAEAQRANLAKDQFLATLSHELRTPLNAIMGWLSMLRRPEVMTSGGTPKAWAAVDRNTNALAELIEDLLDVSRIATGKFRLVISDVDLNEIARDIVRTVEPLFAEKGVLLSPDFAPRPCTLRGDVGRLRQVASNLLSNAVKFTPTGGRVGISVRCDDTTATLTVRDTGIGIHPEFLPHVFERFRQGDVESKAGLGLGLAIVKNLVELHGGTVIASSDGVGLGSQFTATLPR